MLGYAVVDRGVSVFFGEAVLEDQEGGGGEGGVEGGEGEGVD